MWKLLLVLALPLAPLAAAQTKAPEGQTEAAMQSKQPAGPQCLIRATGMPGGVRLQGVVTSAAALSGTYHFDVRKAGSAGTSSSAQSGEFAARPGAEDVVSEVGIGLERGASYEARLVISWPGGETSCVERGPHRL